MLDKAEADKAIRDVAEAERKEAAKEAKRKGRKRKKATKPKKAAKKGKKMNMARRKYIVHSPLAGKRNRDLDTKIEWAIDSLIRDSCGEPRE